MYLKVEKMWINGFFHIKACRCGLSVETKTGKNKLFGQLFYISTLTTTIINDI